MTQYFYIIKSICFRSVHSQNQPSRGVSTLDSKFFVRLDKGSSLGVSGYMVWDVGQWPDSVSSSRVSPSLNGYRKKSGKVNRKSVQKHKMSGPQSWIALPDRNAMKWRSAPPIGTVKFNAIFFTFLLYLIHTLTQIFDVDNFEDHTAFHCHIATHVF